ncbi:hypothetical protein M569_16971, partial [Genlisea aurea]
LFAAAASAQSRCSTGCDLALGSYYIWPGTNLTFISQMMAVSIPVILTYNPQITNKDLIYAGTRINLPFSCGCFGGEFLGHVFSFATFPGVNYQVIAQTYYSNLTTVSAMQAYNSYPSYMIPDTGVLLNVTVNCSCGDAAVSKAYGLFITYPVLPGDTLQSVAAAYNLSTDLVSRYNPTANFSSGSGILFIPANVNGAFPSLIHRNGGLPSGAIAGISAAMFIGVLLVAGVLFAVIRRKKRSKSQLLLPEEQLSLPGRRSSQSGCFAESKFSSSQSGAPALTGITVDKAVEFPYEELASATDDFNISHKIGGGGFGSVYYAELRGEKAAIKKMDMQASKEFLAELKVLTHVHHRNLVRLIGYCVEGSLFLVYEYIENGNLSQHLRGSGREPLSWSTRVQIALDSARGLEYIHEHTVPVYVHRDIKPANILIDNKFHAKVADFGLTKLTEVGSNTLPTGRLAGTFGYMPPEYAQYGDVSPKVDVYAFGVVLYELISAKEAIVKSYNSLTDSRGLVALFDEVLSSADPEDNLRRLVDPRLGENYSLESIQKMAKLAETCCEENPAMRPSMRSVVVSLMTLSSTTDDWSISSLKGGNELLNLMSG